MACCGLEVSLTAGKAGLMHALVLRELV